jgi:hypothetical protein
MANRLNMSQEMKINTMEGGDGSFEFSKAEMDFMNS